MLFRSRLRCGSAAPAAARQQPLARHSTATAAPQRDRGSLARDSTLGSRQARHDLRGAVSQARSRASVRRESTPKTGRDYTRLRSDYGRSCGGHERSRSDYGRLRTAGWTPESTSRNAVALRAAKTMLTGERRTDGRFRWGSRTTTAAGIADRPTRRVAGEECRWQRSVIGATTRRLRANTFRWNISGEPPAGPQ